MGTRIELCGQLAVEHEVREQQSALTAAQRALDPRPLDLDRELSTELDAGPHWRGTYRDTGVGSIGRDVKCAPDRI